MGGAISIGVESEIGIITGTKCFCVFFLIPVGWLTKARRINHGRIKQDLNSVVCANPDGRRPARPGTHRFMIARRPKRFILFLFFLLSIF